MKKDIFISCSVSHCIEHWILENNLTLLKVNTTTTSGKPQPLKYNKKHQLLYTGETGNNKIITYKQNLNNQFKKIHEVKVFNTPNYISLNKKKTMLFCASYHGNGFSVYSLNLCGLIRSTAALVENLRGCHSIRMHYESNLLFASALKDNKIYIYKIQHNKNKKMTVILKNIISTAYNSGPRHITFHPLRPYLYSINELSGTIDVWFINDKLIKLQIIQSISLMSQSSICSSWSSDIHVHPTGNYLYACDRANSIISLFYIDNKQGTLLRMHTYRTLSQPRSFNISKDGNILVIVGELSNSIKIYYINNNNGYLSKITTQSTEINPLWVLIE
ncbi:beta-propeller fold lactonase family protein [Buchnera aphidicola]|uniref:6-phosphogluconolactonase n=1 Tax=Buchnera aphidicola (Cinara cf. splendens/pseudotsugae 3390) TaxID=2518980 RepID=A0A451CXB9_9GAMM|nr:beta-propeller fold lactonase family protein [Buchnera aphidicola]VFP77769.1 6-phosphogluconolactonase [Buchnera aphidicola (Cinara cf. splendens/pseudotsugae 3390)]